MQIKSRVSDTGGQSARPQMAVQQHSLWFGPPLQSFNMKTLEDTSSVNAFVSRTADLTTMYQSWTWLTTYLIIALHQRRFSTLNSRMYTESRWLCKNSHFLMDSRLLHYLPSSWGWTHLILCRMPFLMQPSQLAGLESSTGSTPAWNPHRLDLWRRQPIPFMVFY